MLLLSENLEKLKCSNCNLLLSIFPIYVTIDDNNQLASICGRCPLPTTNNAKYSRVEFYETLAQTYQFPCINRESGCVEDLLPKDVQKHELQCSYRKINCFIDQCDFNDQYRKWLDHCTIVHSNLIDKKLVIDINESQELQNILKYKGEVFLVQLTYEQNSKWLHCTVKNLGFSDKTKMYQIKINLETKDTVITAKFPQFIGNEFDAKSIDVNIESLCKQCSVVVNCSFIICDNDDDNVDNELNQQILENLKCSYCSGLILPPTYQCKYGHSGCCKCKDKPCKKCHPMDVSFTFGYLPTITSGNLESNTTVFGKNSTTTASSADTTLTTPAFRNFKTVDIFGNNIPIFGSNSTNSTIITSPFVSAFITPSTLNKSKTGSFANATKLFGRNSTTSKTTTLPTSLNTTTTNAFGVSAMSTNSSINSERTTGTTSIFSTSYVGTLNRSIQVVTVPSTNLSSTTVTSASTTTICSTSKFTNKGIFSILNIPNTTLDNIIKLINYHCKFINNGCMFIGKPHLIRSHEQYCLYDNHNCPLKDFVHCDETIYQKYIQQHIYDKHNNMLMITDIKSILIDNKKMINDVNIIKYSNYLFKLIFQFNNNNKHFNWIMQLINPNDGLNNFKFEIDLIDNNNHKKRILIRECCTGLCAIDECIKTSNCVSLSWKQTKEFLVDNVLTFKVRILQ